jgi:hypothetical protein
MKVRERKFHFKEIHTFRRFKLQFSSEKLGEVMMIIALAVVFVFQCSLLFSVLLASRSAHSTAWS